MGNLLGKLLGKALPLDKALALALKLGVLRAPLEMLGKVFASCTGYRTQVCVALAGLIGAAAFFGFLPWDTAANLISVVLGAAGFASMDKVNRILDIAKKVSEEGQKAAPAPVPAPAVVAGEKGKV